MIKNKTTNLLIILMLFAFVSPVIGQQLDKMQLVKKILEVEKTQKVLVQDLTLDALFIEGKKEKDGQIKEKTRFMKKVFLKFLPDTTLMHEEYFEYLKEGKPQKEKDMLKEVTNRTEKKKKRKAKDISYSMYTPFYPENKNLYEYELIGVHPELIEGHVCYELKLNAQEKTDSLINGTYYIDTSTFNFVKIDFAPAKLVKKMMFKLHKLNMTILFDKTEEGLNYPKQFIIDGKGKAALFIGVNFYATEKYSNPVFNSGLDDKIFEVQDGK